MITLGQYMVWLRSVGGHCKNGISLDPEIGMVPYVKLYGPSGLLVCHKGQQQKDALPRSAIDNFNRRLNVEVLFDKSNLKNSLPGYV